MRTQSDIHGLVLEILGDDYIHLKIPRYTLTEDLANGKATIVSQLFAGDDASPQAVEGEGVGFVDALFKGIQASLVDAYPSLAHIHFAAFGVVADVRSITNGSRSDAPGTVRATVENASGRSFEFEHTSPSVSASSVAVIVQAAEHFVNAERAVLRVYSWIEDAKRRNRQDLAERYIGRLADLVQNASYSETIERAKAVLGD